MELPPTETEINAREICTEATLKRYCANDRGASPQDFRFSSRGALIEYVLYRATFDPHLGHTVPAMVALTLHGYRNRQSGRCNPAVETIAKCTGLTRRNVQHDISICAQKGVLTQKPRRSRSGRQATTQYDLLATAPLDLVAKVAKGPLAVLVAMVTKIVWVTGTIEVTSKDLAAVAGIPPGRVPRYLRRLERQGHIVSIGKVWTLPALSEFKQVRRSGDEQFRRSGIDSSAALAWAKMSTKSTPEPFEEEPYEEEHTRLAPQGEHACGTDFLSSRAKGRKRLGLAEQIVEAGGNPRVVASLKDMIEGLGLNTKSVPDPVAFMAKATNELSEFADDVLSNLAANMYRSRSVWPSVVQLVEAAREIADPTIKTLTWGLAKGIPRYGAKPRYGSKPQLRWDLKLSEAAEVEFARLGPNWVSAENGYYGDPAGEFRSALPQTPLAGRELLSKIKDWVAGEMPRAKALAEAAEEQTRLGIAAAARRAAEEQAKWLMLATMKRCEELVDSGASREEILGVVSQSGLDAKAQAHVSSEVDFLCEIRLDDGLHREVRPVAHA
jgi:hypothetical protein